MVIYHLDEDGKPDGMASGDVREVLTVPLQNVETCRGKQIGPREGGYTLTENPSGGYTSSPYWPLYGVSGVSRWRDLVALLNGKNRRGAQEKAVAAIGVVDQFGIIPSWRSHFEFRDDEYHVTQKGEEYDLAEDEADEEKKS
jgi:hypothetical protein